MERVERKDRAEREQSGRSIVERVEQKELSGKNKAERVKQK